jgi:hypothetical protein
MLKMTFASVSPVLVGALLLGSCTKTMPAPPTEWVRGVVSGSANTAFNAVAPASDGSVYVAGWFEGAGPLALGPDIAVRGSGAGLNALLAKYDGAGRVLWAKTTLAGAGPTGYLGLTAQDDGSVIAVGFVEGGVPCSFGESVTVTGPAIGRNMLIARYSATGEALWAKTALSASGASQFSDVALGADGSIYAAGSLSGKEEISVGANVALRGPGERENIFLAKYDRSGTALWARTVRRASVSSNLVAVSANGDGSVLTSGWIEQFDRDASFEFAGEAEGGVVLQGAFVSGQNAVLARYEANGTPKWVRSPTEAQFHSMFFGLASDGHGAAYAVGGLTEDKPYAFGPSVRVRGKATKGGNAVLVKYNQDGSPQWARLAEASEGFSLFRSVAVTKSPLVVVAGFLDGASVTRFGGGVKAGPMGRGLRAALIAYGEGGDAKWIKTVASKDGASEYNRVAVAPDGALFAVGTLKGATPFDFGDGASLSPPSGAPSSAMVVKLGAPGRP